VATVGSNFVLTGGTGSYLSGSTVVTAPFVAALNGNQALDAINAAPPTGSGVASGFANNSATSIDRVICDFAMTSVPPGVGTAILAFGSFIGGYAKNGALYVTFTGTTPVTISLVALAAAVGVTSSQAGDALFANINAIVFKNTSTTSIITIAPGGSNPSAFPVFSGTTPTLAVGPGGVHVLSDPVGKVVSGTACNLLLTPSAGGSLLMAFGGA
jgi:hypothetical protein